MVAVGMHPVGAGHSDVGRTRDQNEDSFYIDDERRLYIVADGMGGRASGEVASAMAINLVSSEIGKRWEEIERHCKQGSHANALPTLVRLVVEHCCRVIYEKSESEECYSGMGCTITLMLVLENSIVMGHVGDTRLYLCRDNKLSQLSSDHTIANELFCAGLIDADEVSTHHYAHVLSRAIGTRETVKVDTLHFDTVPGDRFLICSDGLSEYLDDDLSVARQLAGEDIDEVAEEMVSYANTVGGRDNITAVVVEIRPDELEVEIVDEMSVDLSHKYHAIESVFLFAELSHALLTRVLSHCVLRDYLADEVVMAEGRYCAQLMVVVDGNFAVQRRGWEAGVLKAGDQTGATTLLSPRKARATITSLGRGRVLMLERAPFWRLVRARPWLGMSLLERLGRTLSEALDESVEQREDGEPVDTPSKPHDLV